MSLHLSKCHIVGNNMSWLISSKNGMSILSELSRFLDMELLNSTA